MKALLLAIFILSFFPVEAQKEFDGNRGTRHWMMLTDAPNALYHHLEGEAFDLLKKRSEDISELQTLKQWQQRQKRIRDVLAMTVGPFPERTSLRPKVTSVVKQDGYRIENIVFESQPGYYVTSSLFIPDGTTKSNYPAIVYCSGHSDNGYRAYKNVIVNLVKKGFVVFAFDPMGQGERLQYYDPQTGKSRFPWPSYEHSYVGAQMFITGNTLSNYFIWDGIRAIDYLLTRKEVDPARIGITGRSGGGTQAAFIAAFDDRISAVASENYFTNFKRLYQSMGPQDAEQNFFNGIAAGLDMADLLEVRAPKPALIIATSRDMFPVQGAIETTEEVSRIYKSYGLPGNFSMVSDDAPHASTKKNREAMYAFFQKWLNNPGDPTDEKTKNLDSSLRVTPSGQIVTSLQGATAFSLNKKNAEERMKSLALHRANGSSYFAEILNSAKELSGYRDPGQSSGPLFTGRIQREGYSIEKYLVKGEGDYVIPYLLMKPERSATRALLYLDPSGKTSESAEGGELEWFVKKGFLVLVPDLIGTGEMGPGVFKGDSYIDSVSYNLWFSSMLIGRSIVGIQAGDVVRLARLMKDKYGMDEVAALALKEMSPVLLHAAAFEPTITSVALIEPYASYRSIVMDMNYDPDFIQSTVAGSIGVYDLPDLAGSLAPRHLMITGMTDGAGNNSGDCEEDIRVIKTAYANANAKDQLQIFSQSTSHKLSDALSQWIDDPLLK